MIFNGGPNEFPELTHRARQAMSKHNPSDFHVSLSWKALALLAVCLWFLWAGCEQAQAQGVYKFRGIESICVDKICTEQTTGFSGVCVGNVDGVSVFLTCGHCVTEQTTRVDILAGPEDWQPVQIKARQQPGPDLALLEWAKPTISLTCFPLSKEPPTVGQTVWGSGYRGGGDLQDFQARIVSREGGHLWLSRSIRPGDSGGGVLTIGHELVGILAATETIGQRIDPNGEALAVDWAPVRKLLLDTYGHVPGQIQSQAQPSQPAGKPTVLVFTNRVCPPCRAFWRDMDDSFGEQVRAMVNIVAVEVGDKRFTQYSVTSIPTFYCMETGWRFTGHCNEAKTLADLAKIINQPAIASPKPAPQPIEPAPAPQQPAHPTAPPVDLSPILARLDAIEARLKAVEGKPDPVIPTIPPAATPEDIEALQGQLKALRAELKTLADRGITVQLHDAEGKLIESKTYPPGNAIKLQGIYKSVTP